MEEWKFNFGAFIHRLVFTPHATHILHFYTAYTISTTLRIRILHLRILNVSIYFIYSYDNRCAPEANNHLSLVTICYYHHPKMADKDKFNPFYNHNTQTDLIF